MREKFGRTIDSKAYRMYKRQEDQSTTNVLTMDEANQVLDKLVQESKTMQRDDLPLETSRLMAEVAGRCNTGGIQDQELSKESDFQLRTFDSNMLTALQNEPMKSNPGGDQEGIKAAPFVDKAGLNTASGIYTDRSTPLKEADAEVQNRT